MRKPRSCHPSELHGVRYLNVIASSNLVTLNDDAEGSDGPLAGWPTRGGKACMPSCGHQCSQSLTRRLLEYSVKRIATVRSFGAVRKWKEQQIPALAPKHHILHRVPEFQTAARTAIVLRSACFAGAPTRERLEERNYAQGNPKRGGLILQIRMIVKDARHVWKTSLPIPNYVSFLLCLLKTLAGTYGPKQRDWS